MYHCECSAEGCGLRRLRVLTDVGMMVKPVALDEWRDELEQVQDRLGELFVRPEPRQQAGLYLEALLSSAERKNGWQLAEQIGDARPWRTQRVLSDALWSQDKARALCRHYVIEHLGAPDGVLVTAIQFWASLMETLVERVRPGVAIVKRVYQICCKYGPYYDSSFLSRMPCRLSPDSSML
jgi:hypothetical protein